jgi:hypothetical protein
LDRTAPVTVNTMSTTGAWRGMEARKLVTVKEHIGALERFMQLASL